ncbi:MAG: 6-bladed beta-propeller [Bacteroidia bacterium]|nr:6-bladed beta-propeller [Bacteroidia bacterium]
MSPKFPALIILLTLVVSCSPPAENSEGLTVLDLSQDITVESKMTLSQIATDINYTKLESNPDCFIEKIEQYSITRNYILIYDLGQPKVLLFDRQGKFIRQIGNMGEGPGEYNRPNDVRFSGDEKYILIMDFKKVIRFGIDGKLISETKLPDFAMSIDTFDDGLIGFFSPANSVLMDNYSIAFFDWDGNCTGKLLKRGQEKLKSWKAIRKHIFYSMNDEIRVNDGYSDTVYAVQPDRTIVPAIALKDPHAEEERSIDNPNFQLDVWMETPDYLFFNGPFKKMMHPMYLEKKTGLVYHIPFNKDLKTFGIPNDLDGGAPFWPSRYQDGSVYRFHDSERLKAVLDNPIIDKSAYKDQKLRDKLVAFKKNLSDDDGPILIEIKLK